MDPLDQAVNQIRLAILNSYKAISSQTLTVSGLSSLTVPTDAKYALITVEGGDVRFWMDGTAPATGTSGLLRVSGAAFDITEYYNLNRFRVIDEAGSPILQIQYFQ